MRKVRFKGIRPRGTWLPRRMWRPGEILELDDSVAQQLIREPDFEIVRMRRRRRA